MLKSLGVVIPAYRPDVDKLENYIHEIGEYLSPDTILVEIDKPQLEVPEVSNKPSVVINVSSQRRGKGKAITDGFETLETDVLSFVDADGATPASSFKKVADYVLTEQADLAVGSRRHPEAKIGTNQTVARRYLGDSFAWTARRLLEVSLYDYQCGAKAITAEGWDSIRNHLYTSGFGWDIELIAIASALNLCVAEVPIEWYDHPGSTVAPVRDSLRLARTLIAARHRAKCIQNSRLHNIIFDCYEEPAALIERY